MHIFISLFLDHVNCIEQDLCGDWSTQLLFVGVIDHLHAAAFFMIHKECHLFDIKRVVAFVHNLSVRG